MAATDEFSPPLDSVRMVEILAKKRGMMGREAGPSYVGNGTQRRTEIIVRNWLTWFGKLKVVYVVRGRIHIYVAELEFAPINISPTHG